MKIPGFEMEWNNFIVEGYTWIPYSGVFSMIISDSFNNPFQMFLGRNTWIFKTSSSGFIQHSKIAMGSCAKLLHSNFTSELRLQKIFLSWKLIATTSTKIQFSLCFFRKIMVPNNFPSKKTYSSHIVYLFLSEDFISIIFLFFHVYNSLYFFSILGKTSIGNHHISVVWDWLGQGWTHF